MSIDSASLGVQADTPLILRVETHKNIITPTVLVEHKPNPKTRLLSS